MSPRTTRALKRLAIGVGALAVSLGAAALVVLETPLLLSDLSPAAPGTRDDGIAQRARMHSGHGGLTRWLDRSWVDLELRGEVPDRGARFGFGVDDGPVRLTLRFDPCDHSPMTATIEQGGHTIAVPSEDAGSGHALMVASMRHLFEMPFAMRSADVVRGLPPADGAERVFMSWGAATPQMETDQYVLHLGTDGRLTGFLATVRAVAPFLTADVTYTGHVERDGLALAESAIVRNGPGGPVVHAWRLKAMTLGPIRPAGTRCGPQ